MVPPDSQGVTERRDRGRDDSPAEDVPGRGHSRRGLVKAEVAGHRKRGRQVADSEDAERLANIIEYSQPVLYSHFAGKDAILDAVALRGFEQLAASLVPVGSNDVASLREVFGGYLRFADEHPALYEAMFSLRSGLRFAEQTSPEALRDTFDRLRTAVSPFSAGREDDVAEVAWSTLDGLVSLQRSGRLREAGGAARLDVLITEVVGARSTLES